MNSHADAVSAIWNAARRLALNDQTVFFRPPSELFDLDDALRQIDPGGPDLVYAPHASERSFPPGLDAEAADSLRYVADAVDALHRKFADGGEVDRELIDNIAKRVRRSDRSADAGPSHPPSGKWSPDPQPTDLESLRLLLRRNLIVEGGDALELARTDSERKVIQSAYAMADGRLRAALGLLADGTTIEQIEHRTRDLAAWLMLGGTPPLAWERALKVSKGLVRIGSRAADSWLSFCDRLACDLHGAMTPLNPTLLMIPRALNEIRADMKRAAAGELDVASSSLIDRMLWACCEWPSEDREKCEQDDRKRFLTADDLPALRAAVDKILTTIISFEGIPASPITQVAQGATVPPTDVILWHRDSYYSIGGKPIFIPAGSDIDEALQAFLKHQQPLDTKALADACPNAKNPAAAIRAYSDSKKPTHCGILKPAIDRPERKGAGFFIRIRHAE